MWKVLNLSLTALMYKDYVLWDLLIDVSWNKSKQNVCKWECKINYPIVS